MNCDQTSCTTGIRVDDVKAPYAAPNPQLVEDLVLANHILFDQGVVDAFGHVSVRHDRCADRFLLARNMAPGQVTAEDVIEFTLDGAALNAVGRKVYLERFIHGEIYRAFPQVRAVVHSHSPAIVPLTISRRSPLRAVFHMAGFIGTAAPVFEIRDVAGEDSDLLIRDNRLGAALARHFESSAIVLMRGHGSTIVAGSVQQAVYRAVYAEANARCQITAEQLGEVTYLTEAECRACVESHEAQVQRPWDMWKQQARAKRC
ncbi:class II aldolase/adducin family protein [Burkholderia cenocepacia]|uniref:class II aldolase/adducin family protein n=1 Tax=Burkholderia cenocepacia TaxID=95486 RepID=UPI00163A30DF|nr:class II aldolase/adducin family protein [Burkholderia cenocepacia]